MVWVLDVNETLLDLAPVDGVLARAARPGLVGEWFDQVVRSMLVLTATGGYQEFATLGAAAAEAVVTRHGGRWDDDHADDLARTQRALPAHPDVLPALRRLRRDGHRVVALSNSSTASVQAQLESSGLAPLLDASYSVEQVHRLKPAPETYRLVLEAERCRPEDAVLVAAHDWDVAGAGAVGLRTVLLTRGGHRALPGLPAPDVVATDLGDAVDHAPG